VIQIHIEKDNPLLDIDWLKKQPSGQLQGEHCKRINKYSKQIIPFNITEIKTAF